jgi:hypothetical protein
MDEAVYLYTSIEKHSQTALVPNALDPNHVIYLFPDDGTTGRYQNEPLIRSGLEIYIRKHTSLELIGAKGNWCVCETISNACQYYQNIWLMIIVGTQTV